MRIVGCGNPDAGDDAVGLIIADQLRSRVPPEVEVRTATAGGASLLDWCDGIEALILVDAAHASVDFPTGQWRRFVFPADRERLKATPLSGTHVLGLVEALELAQTLDRLPREVLLFAVAGAQFALGSGLSPTVQHSLPELVSALETITSLGLEHDDNGG
jgi:hydrogenase maturation protease